MIFFLLLQNHSRNRDRIFSQSVFKEFFTDDVCASGADWFLEDKGKESSSMEVPLLVLHIQPPSLFWLVISCFSPCSREQLCGMKE